MDKALRLLHRAMGPSKLLTSRDGCEPYSRDESEAQGRVPDVVVLASCPGDVVATLDCARRAGVPVTPRCAGTGRTGGAVPLRGGIVLSTLGMNKIKEVDVRDRVAVVQPGVILEDLHHAVEREGLFYPPDPNSQASCGLGGNIAENAGGPRAFKYGVTRDYVLGLEAATLDGGLVRTGRRTVKGVVGYDLTALLVGSEGTLGVVTESTLRLVRKPERVFTLLALFSEVRDAGQAVRAVVDARVVPRCLELMDAASLQAIRAQGVGIDARAGAMLLIEVDGDEAACERDMERAGQACVEARALEVLVAQDGTQRDRLWAARRELSPAVRKLAKNKLAEDVVVPAGRIPELLVRVDELAASMRVRVLTYGHAGDGNLHVNFLWDEEDELPRVEAAIGRLFEEVLALRGTISGEHGIGVLKARYLGMEQGEGLIALQQRVKRAFDPRGLLNPGKIFLAGG
jgi:glycolate oxidase